MLGLISLIALWIPKILAQIGLFVAIEIFLLLVVNFECYVATGFSLLRQQFFFELA